jgi:RNA polymerase sigma-70 factor (ECF subfamily)
MLFPFIHVVSAAAPLWLVAAEARETTVEASDAELVAAVLSGDRRAAASLFRRHAPAVARRATRLLARTAEAEDVVQDAFVEAFRDLDRLTEPERFGHWLMGIVMHQAQRRFRRRKLLERLGLSGEDDANLERLVDPSAGPELRAQCRELDQALSGLSVNLRVAWVLRFVEGCSLPEVAEYQRCSLATVKRHLADAHRRLLEHTTFELPGPEAPDPLSFSLARNQES